MSYLGYSYSGGGGTGGTTGGGTTPTTPPSPIPTLGQSITVVPDTKSLNFVGTGVVVTTGPGGQAIITVKKDFPEVRENSVSETLDAEFFNFITGTDIITLNGLGVDIDFTKLFKPSKRKVIKITGYIPPNANISIVATTPGLLYTILGDATLANFYSFTDFNSPKFEIYDNGVLSVKDGEVTLFDMTTIRMDRELYPGDYIIIKEN